MPLFSEISPIAIPETGFLIGTPASIKAKVAAQRQAIAEVQSLKESQSKESAEAQAATDARDAAFDALYPQYADYIKYAKVLLAGNQVLEAIGVKVK